jgi:hypothetical protein
LPPYQKQTPTQTAERACGGGCGKKESSNPPAYRKTNMILLVTTRMNKMFLASHEARDLDNLHQIMTAATKDGFLKFEKIVDLLIKNTDKGPQILLGPSNCKSQLVPTILLGEIGEPDDMLRAEYLKAQKGAQQIA